MVDGPDGPVQRGEVGRGGGEEVHPPAAQNRGVSLLVVVPGLRLGGQVVGDGLGQADRLRFGSDQDS